MTPEQHENGRQGAVTANRICTQHIDNESNVDESWALALINECENMDLETFLQPQQDTPEVAVTQDAEVDEAIYVDETTPHATDSPSTTTAIVRQLETLQTQTEAELKEQLDKQLQRSGWRDRLRYWLNVR
ncbi:MAG: hypothetical protein R3183_10605 [Oleiphilaceae bacterium]|nr:hypothetical protein [Oleiphilaceae bacterium]